MSVVRRESEAYKALTVELSKYSKQQIENFDSNSFRHILDFFSDAGLYISTVEEVLEHYDSIKSVE